MPNAIRTDSRNNRTTGFARPGIYSNQHGTPKQHVHDGDTIAVQLDGNVGVRMLGIDTPEVSFSLPPVNNFVSLEDNRWSDFLSDPFHDRFGPMTSELPARLRAWFQVRCSAPQARTHFEHAVAARDEFQAMIAEDMQIMQQTPDTFSYYMNFGFEIMDGYGRLLCIVNRNQPKANEPTPRPKTYNIRLLERGRAFPYFIWPNINPWDRPESIDKAVIPPGQAKVMADNDTELRMARGAVRNARQQHRGIFDPMNPLLLEPFELRNLSRRVAASRYLIDLNSDSDSLIHPLDYPLVPSTEDRLWIPSAYVPLFEKTGWRVPARPQS